MSKPTDYQIIDRALVLLDEGHLLSLLPAQLMSEFNISGERARKLTMAALKQRQNPERTKK